jgi:probable HAF family extracellular repeat protein
MRYWLYLAGVAVLAGCGDPGSGTADPAGRLIATAAGPASAADLGTLGGVSSYAYDINDHNVVVGQADNGAGQARAFRWSESAGMTDLGTLPGGAQSGAVRILDDGEILGWSEDGSGVQVPVQWDAAGRIQSLGIPQFAGVTFNLPNDFNQKGQVVGTAVANGFEHGWYWSRATGLVDLRDQIPSCLENGASAINASGLVAGTYCGPTGWLHGFVWRLRQGYRDLGIVGDDIANANAAATAISEAGTVAGWIDPHGNTAPAPYLWTKGKGYTLLPLLAGSYPNGYVQGLNSSGVAVGASWDESVDGYQPVAWPTPTTLVRLNGNDPLFGVAVAINARGVAVGWGSEAGNPSHALLWRVADGQPVTATSAGTAGRALPRQAIRGGSGPMSCLSDQKAMASKASLTQCVMRRR